MIPLAGVTLVLAGLTHVGLSTISHATGIRSFGGYLVTGVLSFAILASIGGALSERPTLYVGASGSVMGLLGLTLAASWAAWRRYRTPLTRQNVTFLALIVALQFLFDLSTPRVAMSIHMLGAVAGLALGLLWMASARADRGA